MHADIFRVLMQYSIEGQPLKALPDGSGNRITFFFLHYYAVCKRNVGLTVWSPSVCLSVPSFLTVVECASHIFNVSHQGAARDVASVHIPPSITRTNILVKPKIAISVYFHYVKVKFTHCREVPNGYCPEIYREKRPSRRLFGDDAYKLHDL